MKRIVFPWEIWSKACMFRYAESKRVTIFIHLSSFFRVFFFETIMSTRSAISYDSMRMIELDTLPRVNMMCRQNEIRWSKRERTMNSNNTQKRRGNSVRDGKKKRSVSFREKLFGPRIKKGMNCFSRF